MSNYFLEVVGVEDLKGISTWTGNGATTAKGSTTNMIEIKSFSHNIEMPVSEVAVSSNQGRVHGRSKHEAIEVVRSLDKASIYFHKLCSGGLTAQEMIIHVFANNTDQAGATTIAKEYFNIAMKNVIISKVALSGSGDELPEETLSLSYSAIQWTYVVPPDAQSPVGAGASGNLQAAWSLATNAASYA